MGIEQTSGEPDAAPTDRRRMVGFHGEDLAADFMGQLGWQVVDRNYCLKSGELDLVVSRTGQVGYRTETTYAFVEVKSKTSPHRPRPEASVDANKRRRLIRLARLYLQRNCLREVNVRFDVIAVDLSGDDAAITHFPCAFDADGRVW